MKLSSITTDSLAEDTVLPLVRRLMDPGTSWVAGIPYEYLPVCPSTNTALKAKADESPAGTAIVTDDQTGGRGRLGRQWLSEPGLDLAFSVLLRPRLDPGRAHLLALATGVAVAEVLEEELGLRAQVSLKWPNDVLLAGKKVCGILLEASAGGEGLLWAVAGIGVNVNGEPGRMLASLPPERATEWQGRPRPVSLKEHVGRAVPRAPLLAALLVHLTRWWSALDAPEVEAAVRSLLEGWRARDALAGLGVEIFAGPDRSELLMTGEAAGIGAEGQLLVRPTGPATADGVAGCGATGLKEVFAGDVSVTLSI